MKTTLVLSEGAGGNTVFRFTLSGAVACVVQEIIKL
jgi:hypothetical protein